MDGDGNPLIEAVITCYLFTCFGFYSVVIARQIASFLHADFTCTRHDNIVSTTLGSLCVNDFTKGHHPSLPQALTYMYKRTKTTSEESMTGALRCMDHRTCVVGHTALYLVLRFDSYVSNQKSMNWPLCLP